MMPVITQVSTTNLSAPPLPGVARSMPDQPVVPQQNTPVTKQDIEPNQPELDYAVSRLNEYIQNSRRDLHFSVDKGSGRVVLKVIDPETREVIRQIPSEEVIALAQGRGLKESAGMLLHTKV
jgi:flagellar protein FlaG